MYTSYLVYCPIEVALAPFWVWSVCFSPKFPAGCNCCELELLFKLPPSFDYFLMNWYGLAEALLPGTQNLAAFFFWSWHGFDFILFFTRVHLLNTAHRTSSTWKDFERGIPQYGVSGIGSRVSSLGTRTEFCPPLNCLYRGPYTPQWTANDL